MNMPHTFVAQDTVPGIAWALKKIGRHTSQRLSAESARTGNSLLVGRMRDPVIAALLQSENVNVPRSKQQDTIVLRPLTHNRLLVTGRTQRALIYGILALARHTGVKLPDLVDAPSFDLRLYKHEPSGGTEATFWKRGHWTTTSEAFWTGLFQQMSERRLNGLWFWGNSAFESQLIWNEKYPEARTATKAEFRRISKRFRFILSTARDYGIEVYVNLRVGHCPLSMLRRRAILQRNLVNNGGEDTPILRQFTRDYVARMLEHYPELAGFWLYFESLPNAYDFIRESFIEPMLKIDRPLKLFTRTWFLAFPHKMQELAQLTRGSNLQLILPHKQHADRPHYPNPHPRFKRWMRQVPDAQVMMMTGPCHTTSGHGIGSMSSLWADKDYVQTILHRAHRMGVPHMTFNTVAELFDKPADDPAFSRQERILSTFNNLHLEAAARAMWKAEPEIDAASWRRYVKTEYGLKHGGESAFVKLIDQSSKLANICNLQFFGSRPGFEQPYLQHTASSDEDQPGECEQYMSFSPPRVKSVTGDYLRVIDVVNGKRDGHTPQATIRELKAGIARSHRYLEAFATREKDFEKTEQLKHLVTINSMRATYCMHSVEAQLALFALVKSRSRRGFVKKLEDGLLALKNAGEAARACRDAHRPVFGAETEGMQITGDLEDLRRVRDRWRALRNVVARDQASFTRFRQYLASLHAYMQISDSIRLYNRTYRDHRVIKKARQQLDQAMAALHGAVSGHDRRALFLRDWLGALEQEKRMLRVRTLKVERIRSARDLQHVAGEALYSDHVFFGEDSVLNAFLRFFGKGEPSPRYRDSIRFALGYDGGYLHLAVDGESDMGDALFERWSLNQHVRNSTFFIIVNLNLQRDKRNVTQVRVTPSGKVRRYAVSRQTNGGLYREALPGKRGIQAETRAEGGGRWRTRIRIPFDALGAVPEPGVSWDFNLYSRPSLTDKTPWIYDGVREGYAWTRSYGSVTLGGPYRMGTVTFV